MAMPDQDAPLWPAMAAVINERFRQDEKWGVQNYTPAEWMLIFMEEVGEFSQAVLDARVKGADPKHVREELVQVAAVAMAMLECCDRNGWDQ